MSQTTKRALAMSLRKLLQNKPLDKITVVDIVEDCGVNRQTFYYHFRDIYDLVEWELLNTASILLDGRKNYATWQEGYLHIFQAVLDNREMVLHAYKGINRESMEEYLHQMTFNLLIAVVNEQAEGMHVSVADREYIAHFYKYVFVGLVLDWIKKGMKEQPERVIERLSFLIHGDIHRALQKYRH